MTKWLIACGLVGTFMAGTGVGLYAARKMSGASGEPTAAGTSDTIPPKGTTATTVVPDMPPDSNKTKASTRPATPCKVRYHIGGDLLATMPAGDEWNYPQAEVTSKYRGGLAGSSGVIEFGREYSVVMSTEDPVEKVWQYYRGKLDIKEESDPSSTGFGFTNSPEGVTFDISDKPERRNHPLPDRKGSQAKVFSVDSQRFHLVMMVFRGATDTATTIVVSYRPNKEFLSVLKEIAEKD